MHTHQLPTFTFQSTTISTPQLRLPFHRRLREALSVVFKSIPLIGVRLRLTLWALVPYGEPGSIGFSLHCCCGFSDAGPSAP
ncbi:hypothetical protein PIB30_044389 [Stylosanthes scabra]|uniref:Uncharacterized protein n=1 Tax=Stylosanthes scabra TaxID=79078 RepID=A0ABU6XGR6_9FABA|nr:hypothetical protein [Stylosanthes scabra]